MWAKHDLVIKPGIWMGLFLDAQTLGLKKDASYIPCRHTDAIKVYCQYKSLLKYKPKKSREHLIH